MAVAARADVAFGLHGAAAEGTDGAPGGDDLGDLAAEDAALASSKTADQGRLLDAGLVVEHLDDEQSAVFLIAEGHLQDLHLDVEDGAEGCWLDVGGVVAGYLVQLLDGLVEPFADALELLLLHPDRGGLAAGAHHEPESALSGLAYCFGVYGDGFTKIVSG